VRLGIQLPEVEREVRWPEYVAMAHAAEAAGFDSIWVGDHLLYRRPDRGPWEAWTLLSALAAATERVRLGPLVACAGFHPPGLIAKPAATERPIEVPPLDGPPDRIAERLRELGEAGADEAILVATPITEPSIRALADVVART
jgi:alkanesulfonate monooxygenase SsuD/methylene tetrahydromethanopterin reductase-like flavin-dependent oxidoreductase (luciferase family)